MDDAPDSLGRFVPLFLRRRCVLRPDAQREADAWPLSGALLFVDLVGFTAQVEQFAAGGPEGGELAVGLLNDTIGGLVDGLTAAGGDVTVFAGDALFVLWPQLDDESTLAPAVLRAARAALDALERKRLRADASAPRMRFSLGAGAFVAHRVGGHADRWHALLAGPPLAQIGRLDALAQNDALLASPEACALADGAVIGPALADGGRRVRRLARDAAPAGRAWQPPPGAREALARLVSEAVDPRLPLRAQAMAEFRHPSAVFARLPGLLRDGNLDGARAHEAAGLVQRIVAELEGTTLQFVVDDKGPVFVIAFGLAAHVHEDDPARAALAALRIVEALTARGIACGAGVATGRVFCGLIGAESRCSYTLIGRTMNLAARLMQRAAPGPLVDEATRDLSRGRVGFVQEGALRVKGLDAEVPHYRAVAAVGEPTPAEPERGDGPVGRSRELDILEGQLDLLARERRGGLVVLVGEAGIGKSRLVRELVARAAGRGLAQQVAAAGAIESGPSARWRPALQALVDPATDDPYLRAFMGHSADPLPDADDAERAFRTREAMAGVILAAARRQPLLLCVEDTHWMDSLSWALVTRLAQATADAGAPLLLVLTTREFEARAPADALARLTRAGMLRLPLGPLAPADCARVAQIALGVEQLPPGLGDWVATQSGGNPLFCRELAVAALESGRVRRVGGRIELHPALWSGEAAARLPGTLQGVIASRLDRLDTAGQWLLRVAAVIGSRFTRAALKALLPESESDPSAELLRLQDSGFLDREPAGGEEAYAFHHALVRDAAYDSLPYRRRRELHSRLALWLERRFADDLGPHAATLAFHWERAEAWDVAYTARLRAGEIALQSYSNREAVEHFNAAAQIRQRLPATDAPLQARSPELGLARALHRMGDQRGARAHIEQALRSVGENLPRTPFTRGAAILGELVSRAVPLRSARRASPRLRAKVAAYDLLPEILYYDNDPLALTHATLRFLRLAQAERGRSAEHARARAWYALLQAGLGRRAAMESSFDEALRLAADAGDPAVDAWIRLARGSTHAQLGQWTIAERWLRDARARCAALGDRTRWWNVTSGLAHALAYRGELADAETLLREAIEVNRDTDNPLFLCWGLSGHADLLHRLGHAGEQSEVLRSLRRAREALAQRPDAAADLFSRGVLAAALWRAGHGDEAWELARETVDQTLHRAPMVWLQISSYLGLALVLEQSARDVSRRGEAQRLLARLERSLRGFARLIPIARPTLALVRGDGAMARGDAAQARQHYASALAQAEAMGQPLESGKALLALAEIGGGAQTLERAAAIFERIGARWHLEQARRPRDTVLAD